MADLEVTIKKDFMVKRSMMKGRIKTENYKGRWFVLSRNFLCYCDGSIETGVGRTKGEIPLTDIQLVEPVHPDSLGNRCSAFQVVYKTYCPEEDILTLYIQASHEDNKWSWISAVRQACLEIGVKLSDRYHPGVVRCGKYTCCDAISKHAVGCVPSSSGPNQAIQGYIQLQACPQGQLQFSPRLPESQFMVPQGQPLSPLCQYPCPQNQVQFSTLHSQAQCPPSQAQPLIPQDHLQPPQLQPPQLQPPQLQSPQLQSPPHQSHHSKPLPQIPSHRHLPPGAVKVLPKACQVAKKPSDEASHKPDAVTVPPAASAENGRPVPAPRQAQLQSVEPLKSQPPEEPNGKSQPQVPGGPVAKPRVKVVKTGKMVLALYAFKAIEPEDLCLVKGETYEVLDDSEPYWWKIKNKSGDTGYIPANYTQAVNENGKTTSLRQYDWYYSDTTPSLAEEILKQMGTVGCFIVRDSRRPGRYSLSVLCSEQTVKHYQVKVSNGGLFYFVEGHAFSTLPELIVFHKQNAAGLLICLKSPPTSDTRCTVMLPSVPLGHGTKEILLSELTILEDLGAGNFGEVVHGKYKNSVDVAVKMVKDDRIKEKEFIAEAKAMAMLNHKNLVILYGVCNEVNPIYIVMEFMKHGALLNYLRCNRHKILDETFKLIDMCLQVCKGMEYLESKMFVHQNLSARNCLIGENNTVKISDFGLARFVDEEFYKFPTKYLIKWSAPEVIEEGKFSSKSDVWSFGVLTWEIFTGGKVPYKRLQPEYLVMSVCKDELRLPQPKKCPQQIFSIMAECWKSNPDKRPSFAQLKTSIETVADTS